MIRPVFISLSLALTLFLSACGTQQSVFDPDAPWTGTWIGDVTFEDFGTEVNSSIRASFVQQQSTVTGTVTITTVSTSDPSEYDTTLRTSVDSVVISDNTIEGDLECVSMSGRAGPNTFTACDQLPGYMQRGAFEAQLTSDDTAVGSLPDAAAAGLGFGNIPLRRR